MATENTEGSSEIIEVQIADDVVRLMKAVKEGLEDHVVKLLDAHPELVNRDEGSGRTALHFAAHAHNTRMIELLVSKYGAKVDAEDMDQYTPLMLAAVSTNSTAAAKNKAARGSLSRSAVDALEKLLSLGADINYRTSKGVTALHKAAAVGNVAMIRFLVEHGARATSEDAAEFGSVLHFAALHGDAAAESESGSDSKVSLVELLVRTLGVDVNTRDSNGGTALHIAAAQGCTALVRELLRLGADVNAQAADQSTPLHLAAEFQHAAVVKLLIAHGAEPHSRDNEGLSAYNIAEQKGNRAIRSLFESMFGDSLERSLDAVEARERVERNEKAVRENIKTATQWKQMGNSFFGDGDYDAALRSYQHALKLLAIDDSNVSGERHVLHSNCAAAYFNMKDYSAAAAAAAECIALNPGFAKGYFRHGSALAALERWDEARQTLEAGLAKDPANKDLKTKLAEVIKLQTAAESANKSS